MKACQLTRTKFQQKKNINWIHSFVGWLLWDQIGFGVLRHQMNQMKALTVIPLRVFDCTTFPIILVWFQLKVATFMNALKTIVRTEASVLPCPGVQPLESRTNSIRILNSHLVCPLLQTNKHGKSCRLCYILVFLYNFNLAERYCAVILSFLILICSIWLRFQRKFH